ncbi:hypothetical protein CLF_107930 [Clonorchis sinensis]|uniref:Uncharacterized protein n=1 Tax=Clonorchis sinensis TaxID=79923 RepID=G7YHD0_CLOSI|nr:hypothetical protein CLF_107930 [Clonorchis sinensis]
MITRQMEELENCYCVHHSRGIIDQRCVGDIAGSRFWASKVQCFVNCMVNGNVQPNISQVSQTDSDRAWNIICYLGSCNTQRHANSPSDTNKLVPVGHMQDAIDFLCNNAFR